MVVAVPEVPVAAVAVPEVPVAVVVVLEVPVAADAVLEVPAVTWAAATDSPLLHLLGVAVWVILVAGLAVVTVGVVAAAAVLRW